MTDNSYDVIMVGGGLMGCATAYYLMKTDSRLRVAIVEMDPTYERSSTILSDGNVRVQFNLAENIRISQYGLEAIERFAEEMAVDDDKPDVAFRREGNLFLIDEDGLEEAERGLALQRDLGCQVEWLTPVEIGGRLPLYDLAGCVGGTFGRQDGTMDPWALLMGFKRKAISLGARFIHAEVAELLRSKDRITGVRLSSGERLFISDCAWAICCCMRSINSSRSRGGFGPKKSPNSRMKPSKSGSSPFILCSSIWFRASTMCRILARDSGSRFFTRSTRSRPNDCMACFFNISSRSRNC